MLGRQKRWVIGVVVLLIITGITFAEGGRETTTEGPIKLAVVGDAGHNLLPLEWIREDAKARGIELEVIGVPFTAVYEVLKTEFVGGTSAYDVVVFYPSYLGEFAEFGYLQPLDPFFSLHDPELDDVIPAYRDLYTRYKGQTYALAYDGDVLNFYFRTDLFDHAGEKRSFQQRYGRALKVPETWDELLEVAEFFTRSRGETLAGQTLNEDIYGFSFLGARGFAYAWWANIFGSLGGAYFDRNMTPQINTQVGLEALDILNRLKEFSPPDVMNMGYEELKNAFLEGRLATMIQWSDVWKKANDPAISKIVGNAGVTTVPGVRQADGSVYFRAATPVGRVIGIPSTTRYPEEAYWVAWKLTTDISLDTVSTSLTGLDPYRFSHVNPAAFSEFGPPDEAQAYLEAVMANLNALYPDLNIPGAAEYLDALDIAVTSALSGTKAPRAALNEAAARWNEITETLGRDTQLEIYNAMLDVWVEYGFWED